VRVVLAHLWFLSMSGRVWLLFALFAALGAVFPVAADQVEGQGALAAFVSPLLAFVVAILAACWGCTIWWNEPPAQREYHWSLPVDATVNDIARVAAGALALSAAVLFLLVFGLIVLAVRGENLLALRSVPVSFWLSILCAGLIVYLLCAALATLTGRVIETLVIAALGIRLVGAFVDALPQTMTVGYLRYYLYLPVEGRLGMETVVTGMTIYGRSYLEGRAASGWSTTWIVAMLLWLSIALVLLVFSSAVHRWRRAY
jgi:hypothetical protein